MAGNLLVNTEKWQHRLVIGHPVTGNVRVEWVMGRFGQTIPCNWSHVDILQFMSPFVPLQYQVADAENLIMRAVIDTGAEWLLSWEHDNIPGNDALIRLNEYMRDKKVPVVSGLYFTKSEPPEPMVYRGIGNSYFQDWRLGDKVWCSGIPMGFTLIHASILRAMWEESPEYIVNGQVTRRVFETPSVSWADPETGHYLQKSGTSDLQWCQRVIAGDYFRKAGWKKYAGNPYPFLVDTNLFVRHIDQNGAQYPLTMPRRFAPNGKPKEIK